jgi:hypothetical protein
LYGRVLCEKGREEGRFSFVKPAKQPHTTHQAASNSALSADSCRWHAWMSSRQSIGAAARAAPLLL